MDYKHTVEIGKGTSEGACKFSMKGCKDQVVGAVQDCQV